MGPEPSTPFKPRLCAGGGRKFGLEASTAQATATLPHVIKEALKGAVIALAVLSEDDHPQYAFVYSAGPKFHNKYR